MINRGKADAPGHPSDCGEFAQSAKSFSALFLEIYQFEGKGGVWNNLALIRSGQVSGLYAFQVFLRYHNRFAFA